MKCNTKSNTFEHALHCIFIYVIYIMDNYYTILVSRSRSRTLPWHCLLDSDKCAHCCSELIRIAPMSIQTHTHTKTNRFNATFVGILVVCDQYFWFFCAWVSTNVRIYNIFWFLDSVIITAAAPLDPVRCADDSKFLQANLLFRFYFDTVQNLWYFKFHIQNDESRWSGQVCCIHTSDNDNIINLCI